MASTADMTRVQTARPLARRTRPSRLSARSRGVMVPRSHSAATPTAARTKTTTTPGTEPRSPAAHPNAPIGCCPGAAAFAMF